MHSHNSVGRGPEGRPGRRLGAIVAAAVAVAGAAWLVRAASSGTGKSGSVPKTAIHSVRVTSGSLERTIRLTGTTAPERFAALTVPQLRGSRHGPDSSLPSDSRASTSAISSAPTFRASGGGSSSSSASSTAAAPSSASSSAASSASGAGAASRGTSLANALNRFSTPTSGTGSSGSSSSSKRAALTSESDKGSTASSLPGGSNGPPAVGGSGGGDDWHVILQSVVPPGSQVRKGQVIAEFDRQYQLVRLDDFRAAATSMQQSLKALRQTLDVEAKAHKASIEAAKADLDKARYDLKTIPVQSAIAAERLKLAEEEASARYKELLSEVKLKEAARASEWRMNTLEIEQGKIELARVEANADKLLVRAPLDGTTVMSSTWRGGEMGQIRAGDELHPGMMFARVVDSNSMVINASLNQSDIELLRVGFRARVRFDAYPDLELPARVYSIGAMPRTGGFRATYVKEVPVVLKLDGLDPRVIPDLSVSVDVVVAAEASAVLAPLEGIFTDAPGTPGARYVFVGTAGGWERREVEIGLTNNVAAVIRSGLRPGEVIASERPPQEKR